MSEILPSWKRLCGIHIDEGGQVAAVWLAHDKTADVVHVYDVHTHEREVVAVQAESLKRRGRWIPIAWHSDAADMVEKLLEHGCSTLPEGIKDSDSVAEVTSLDIWERMRTGRFKVAKHLKSWLAEFETFQRKDMKVPRDTHPLMAATRHAVAQLEWAKAQPKKAATNFPKLATV